MADQTTTIPKGWKMTTLGVVAEKIAMGPFGSNIKIETFVDEGVPVISGTHLNGYKLEDKDYNFITSEHADKLKSSIVFADDIIFTHAGNIGQVAYIPKNSKYKKYILSQRQFFLRPKKGQLQTEYLTYFFKTREGQHKLLANANQTGVPSIAQPASYLKSIEINLPPLPEQHAIAAVLSSLDDKIELLREQNKTLEATAQAIFKEWFVNFNFPGTTGKMIDSELGEIPEGWKVDRLSEIIVFEGGAQPPKSEHIYEPRDGYVRFIQNRDYSNSSHITYIKESKKNKLCEVFDIMMDKYGDVGVPRWGLVGAYNVALAKIVPKIKNSREYLRSYFSQRAVFSLLSASAQASTRGSLNEGTFKGVTLIIPDEITLERFEKLQSKFLSKILFNNAEVETLSQLRDTLLPKLMKGEIRVAGFNE